MTYAPDAHRYDTMTYRRSGRSGLLLPAVSLGIWHNFGPSRSFETQRAIVRRAFDLGVTHIDAANNYGPPPGAAEETLGRLVAGDFRHHRDELILSTKAGYLMWPGPYGDHGSRKYLLASLDQSLSRLGVDYVDVFYHHRPDPETPLEETMGALADAVRLGKALYVGVSSYSPEETREAAAILRSMGLPLTIHQPRYSLFDRQVEHGLLDAVTEVGAGTIVFSPLAQGLLTNRYLDGAIPADSRAATSRFLDPSRIDDAYLARARALSDIARRRGQSLAQLALRWVLRRPEVTSALVGASSVAQLEQNVAALEGPDLTAAELAEIEPLAVDLPSH
ncbi:MAG TPA: aldo/keto reductase [Microbacteriaceae bacterium]|nr:aldo/keto reductase [Microbacteriaceae bacterium]